MINFFKSEDVRIFPCTYRGLDSLKSSGIVSDEGQVFKQSINIDPESHMLSEYNLAHLAGLPAGKTSYINSFELTTDKILSKLDCVIHGYHIRLKNINTYSSKPATGTAELEPIDDDSLPF